MQEPEVDGSQHLLQHVQPNARPQAACVPQKVLRPVPAKVFGRNSFKRPQSTHGVEVPRLPRHLRVRGMPPAQDEAPRRVSSSHQCASEAEIYALAAALWRRQDSRQPRRCGRAESIADPRRVSAINPSDEAYQAPFSRGPAQEDRSARPAVPAQRTTGAIFFHRCDANAISLARITRALAFPQRQGLHLTHSCPSQGGARAGTKKWARCTHLFAQVDHQIHQTATGQTLRAVQRGRAWA